MKILSPLCTFLLIGILASCATDQPLPKETISQLKRVGVVSQTSDSLYRQYVGVTVFGNELDVEDISAWNLDEIYEEQLATAVRGVFKSEALVLTQYRSQFGDVNSLNGPYSAPAFWGPNFDKIGDVTRRVCQEQALDAVIVVARWQSADILGGTNQKVEGVGVYARRGNAKAHVLSEIGFMECKSGKVLTVGRLIKPTAGHSDSFRERVVTAPFDPAVAAKPYSTWSQAEKDRLKQILSELPTDAWEPTLRSMLPNQ